jgi:hypothetical protein
MYTNDEMYAIQTAALNDGLCIALLNRSGDEMGCLHHSRVQAGVDAGVRDLSIGGNLDGWVVKPTSELGEIFMQLR